MRIGNVRADRHRSERPQVERSPTLAARARRRATAGRALIERARRRRAATLLGLWGERRAVHMALLDEASDRDRRRSASTVRDGTFPSVGAVHPPAIRLERAIRDLFGLAPVGSPDPRPWLDHGRWGVRHPLGSDRRTRTTTRPYAFLPAEGEGLHQIPVGPVHAGIIEPGHFRFTANGETVVRLEERLGYVHKGIEGADGGRDARARREARRPRLRRQHRRLCARLRPRGRSGARRRRCRRARIWLRALMAELERLANHLGDIGAICNDASFSLMHAHCGILRERRAARGGCLLRPSADDGSRRAGRRRRRSRRPTAWRACARSLDDRAPALPRAGRALRQHRLAAGPHRRHRHRLARPWRAQFGAGGYVGRASGRGFDARTALRLSAL